MKKRLLCFLLFVLICCPLSVLGGTVVDQNKVYKTVSGSGKYCDVVKWGKNVAVITSDRHRIQYTLLGGVFSDVCLDFFEESDIPDYYGKTFVINDIDVVGDQLIAGCNEGIVLIITDCMKCYKLKKVCDFDITKIAVDNVYMTVYGAAVGERAKVPLDVVRQSKIAPSEVRQKVENGAYLIDVRDKADFLAGHIECAVNIPIDSIEKIGEYPANSTLVFYCYSGNRSGRAVETARGLGFVNVYNAGGYEDLLAEY